MKKLFAILFCLMTLISQAQVKTREVEVTGLNTRTLSSTPEKTLNKVQIDSLNNFTETGFFLRNFANNVTTTSDGSGQVGYNYYKIRGIDNPRLNFTLNGVPINDQLDGWTFLSNLPDFTNNMGQVQVQYGVGTSSYGLAPVGGSIHFKSLTPLDTQNTQLEYSLGSFGFNRYSVSNNTGLIGGKFKFSNRFSNMYTKGFRENSEFLGKTFFSTGGYYGEKNEITYTFMTGDIKSQMCYLPSDKTSIEQNYRHNPLTSQWDGFNQSIFMVNSKHKGRNWTNESSVYVNGVYGKFEVPDVIQKAPYHKVSTNGTNIGAYTINTFYLNNSSIVKLGTNLIHTNRIQSFTIDTINYDYYRNTNTKTQASQFVKYEVSHNGFDFYVDLEARYVNMGYVDNLDDSLKKNKSWMFFNPKFGVTKKMGNFVSYASFGQVTREPYRLDMLSGYDDVKGFESRFSKIFNMGDVSPETVNNFETGIRFFGKSLTGSVNFYYMDFRNEIVPVGIISPMTSLPVRGNVSRSYRRGVELNLSKKISIFNLTTNVNYNESRILRFVDESKIVDTSATEVNNNTHLLSPQWVIRNNIGVNFKNSSLTLTHNYVSQSYLSNNNSGRFVLPEYNIFGARLDVKVKNFYMFAIVDNLLDNKYFTSGYILPDNFSNPNALNSTPGFFVQPTRNFMFGVKVSI